MKNSVKKLNLQKMTIANLDQVEMNSINGGKSIYLPSWIKPTIKTRIQNLANNPKVPAAKNAAKKVR